MDDLESKDVKHGEFLILVKYGDGVAIWSTHQTFHDALMAADNVVGQRAIVKVVDVKR